MHKAFQGIALTCGVLVVVLLIVSMSTPHWMKACFPAGKLLELSSQMMSSMGNRAGAAANLNAANALKDKQICFNLGLFEVKLSLGSIFHMSFPIKINAMDSFFEAAAGLLIITVLLFFPALIFIGLSACSDSISESRKLSARKYARVGMGLLICGTVVLGVGAATYTAGQSPMVHNPQKFYVEIGTAISSGVSEMMSGGGGGALNFEGSSISGNINDGSSYYLGNGARKRRQLGNTNVSSSFSNSMSGFKSGGDSMAATQQQLMALMTLVDPVFDFSFYFVWVGFLMAIFASVLSVLGYRRMKVSAGDGYRAQLL